MTKNDLTGLNLKNKPIAFVELLSVLSRFGRRGSTVSSAMSGWVHPTQQIQTISWHESQ